MSEGFKTCLCLQALTGKHASPAAAAEHLEKIFSEGGKAESKRVTVLLVDEMDLLITKKQQVRHTHNHCIKLDIPP